MRLWTLHPRHLDPKGLVALWREALLAQAVLRGETKGYRHHPQLDRFRAAADPAATVAAYLVIVFEEAQRRGYSFDGRKVGATAGAERLTATRGQVDYEWAHLREKLRVRAPTRYADAAALAQPEVHPLFRVVSGGVADWEVITPAR